jgi:SAM-dependent methyltransferase
MVDWAEKTFKNRADLMLMLMNLRWPRTVRDVQGMLEVLKTYGKSSGSVLDLCCGNGRISTHFALKGFPATGVDYSAKFIDDAVRRATENGITDMVSFIVGDIKDLDKLLGKQRFDVVINAWTSIGYTTKEDDEDMFRQARLHASDDAIFFIIDTAHQGRASMRPTQSSSLELDDMVMLEDSSYNMLTSRQHTTWRFYRKSGDDLIYVDTCEYDIYIYSLSELSSLLRNAGWEVDSYYGDIRTKQPMSSQTGMNVIAKAIN